MCPTMTYIPALASSVTQPPGRIFLNCACVLGINKSLPRVTVSILSSYIKDKVISGVGQVFLVLEITFKQVLPYMHSYFVVKLDFKHDFSIHILHETFRIRFVFQ